MNSLISPDNTILVFFVIVFAASFGIYSEYKKWFWNMSGIVITMITTAVLSMTGVIPTAFNNNVNVEAYNLVNNYFIPVSIPLLLFSSNIMKIIREGGRLLIAYMIGAVGVVAGAFLAFYLIDLGAESNKTAGVISSTLIGGSINFNATAKALNFEGSPLFSATIAVDVIATNLYTILIIMIPSMGILSRLFAKHNKANEQESTETKEKTYEINLERIAIALLIAFGIAALGEMIAPYMQSALKTDINLSILIITLFSIIAANLFPKQLKSLENTAFVIGLWMMYMFLALIGASTDIHQIVQVGPAVLAFFLIILFFHLILMISVARLFKLDVYEVVIASAANIMGPSVAAPMAASMKQKKLITPGILVGILGYVIGTFVGVGMAVILG
jgi:uncharacterized membrane protein